MCYVLFFSCLLIFDTDQSYNTIQIRFIILDLKMAKENSLLLKHFHFTLCKMLLKFLISHVLNTRKWICTGKKTGCFENNEAGVIVQVPWIYHEFNLIFISFFLIRLIMFKNHCLFHLKDKWNNKEKYNGVILLTVACGISVDPEPYKYIMSQ